MMKKVDSFVRLDILEEHKRSIMSILSDWEIKHLVEKENMIEPFVAKEVKEINGKKTLSYGLSSYGYDIRLSEEKCSLFGGTQTGMCDPKDFDFEILKSTTLNEDERGKYFILPPYGYCLCRAEEKLKLPKIFEALIISLTVTFITILFAFPIAYYISFYGGKRKALWLFLITIPFWTSYLLRMFLWKVILGYNGVLNSFFEWLGVITEPLTFLKFQHS